MEQPRQADREDGAVAADLVLHLVVVVVGHEEEGAAEEDEDDGANDVEGKMGVDDVRAEEGLLEFNKEPPVDDGYKVLYEIEKEEHQMHRRELND